MMIKENITNSIIKIVLVMTLGLASSASTKIEKMEELLIHRPETPTLLGVDLNDYRENFPSDPNDPRFTDDDEDGKPGVTVNLTFKPFVDEELYIARKEIFSYDMKKMKNRILAGFVRDRSHKGFYRWYEN